MKTFVISLKNSPRRERVKTLLGETNLKYQFFDAISTKSSIFHMHNRANPTKTFWRKGFILKDTEIACFASHYLLWQRCIALDEPIVIFEDNFELIEGAVLHTENAFSHINKYGYIKLSTTENINKPPIFHKIEDIDDLVGIGYYNQETAGTTAYIISPKVAKSLIDGASEFIDPVDNYMEKPWLHGVQTFAVFPNVFYRANIPSEIGKRKDKSNRFILARISKEIYRTYELLKRKLTWHK
ncbi:glycosyltransferase family 25 protein [Vibrio sp. B1Z05]|uniref:glycosyltransferase family 25 protein n=1 Tax=Vibrio sp. B1Z05 TaxID=2654980 RepID=UPI00128DBBF6|nr:glycosyltransferase family 25 protein [Vibrio sp. B1Z05]MPW37520.1 glycosyltransferase [Vibrio sp. B1Z05]